MSDSNRLIQIGHVEALSSAEFGEQIGGPRPNEATRRRFLEIMGASMAMATGAGCTRPPSEYLMPYVHPPEQAVPGSQGKKYYATAAIVNGVGEGVIAETHLGRPTKIDGNRLHPASLGATTVLGQASVLDLYDPYRAQEVANHSEISSWDAFMLDFDKNLDPIRTAHGEGLTLLTETVTSPTLGWQIRRVMKQFPKMKWRQWDPAGPHTTRAGSLAAFGRYVNTMYRLDRAEVILSLDSDFLAFEPTYARYAHDYAFGRRVRGDKTAMNRLYVIENTMTSTGGKADNRLQLKYSEIGRFAVQLAAALGVTQPPQPAGSDYSDWVGPLSRDLLAHRGRSVILVGEQQPPALHALAHAMNAALGNAGSTVIYTDPIEEEPTDQLASLQESVKDMNAGEVRLLLMLGGNPAYNAPVDVSFTDALTRVPMSIHLSLYPDETSKAATWHVPASHYYETWGDIRAYDGTITVLQPLIEPLYHSRSDIEMVDNFLQAPNWISERLVLTYWREHAPATDFEDWWRESVGKGLIAGSALPEIHPTLKTVDTQPLLRTAAEARGIEITFRPDPYIYDGRYASNAWLQELPKHITKLEWDNAVHVSPQTANRLDLVNQHLVEITLAGQSVRGSVWVSPGQANDSITIHLGYGRTKAGPIGNSAGFSAYRIRRSDAMWYASGVSLDPTGTTYPLATEQMEKSLEGRENEILISKPIDVYRSDPNFVQEMHPEPGPNDTLYPSWDYKGYNWGMVIDLTACVNCGTCVIACQAENNIAVVGKEQCLFRRQMHWLRVDTYYTGDWNHPSAVYQPVPCMQCENAPCELVCPVQATLHSDEGLNDMIYNRCVGTRFCSNNCPYKVRRFNFFLYSGWYTEQLKMQYNPSVTVRSRGVMEKCTYCVQRIQEGEIAAKDEDRYLRDGEVQTACQQACPTQAIAFGNMNNPEAGVTRLKGEKLNYAMLASLNTRPHTTYLAELRNPNPEWRQS